MGSFTAEVSDWVAQTKKFHRAVIRESIKELVRRMQTPVGAGGNMPIDTGFLRKSLMASTSFMPTMEFDRDEGGVYRWNDAQLNTTLSGWSLGEDFYLGYTANYAIHQEFGANGRPGRAFVRLAAQQWPEIVSFVEAKLDARLSGSYS